MSFDIYIEEGKKALEAHLKYREVAEKVKEIARKIAGDAKVYVFGSALTGRYTAASDIDILIVTDIGKEEAVLLKAEIYKAVDAPVEIHVTTQEQFKRWYKRFIYKLEEI
jgi:predicted nucleotidyltransferase